MATAHQQRQAVAPYSKLTVVQSDFWGKPVARAADGSLSCPGYTGNTYPLNPCDTLLVSNIEGPLDEFETKFGKSQTPGVIHSITCAKGLDVDEKKAAGGNNARLTLHGFKIARVEIAVKIWTVMQWELLKKLWSHLQPIGGKVAPGSFNCYHPYFKPHGIGVLQFLEGEGPVPGPQPGTRLFIMRAVEFALPSRNSVTRTPPKPVGSKLDSPPSVKPGANPRNTGPT